jgi:protein TonB
MRRLILLAALACAAVPAALVAQSDSTVYTPGNGVTLPSVVKQVKAVYSNEARDQRIEGTVGLTCVVRPDGHVTDVVVTESLDSVFGLDKSAVAAMEQWEFKPGTKDGKAVAVKINVAMTFTLK